MLTSIVISISLLTLGLIISFSDGANIIQSSSSKIGLQVTISAQLHKAGQRLTWNLLGVNLPTGDVLWMQFNGWIPRGEGLGGSGLLGVWYDAFKHGSVVTDFGVTGDVLWMQLNGWIPRGEGLGGSGLLGVWYDAFKHGSVVTDFGVTWGVQKLMSTGFANNTQYAQYLSLSTNSDADSYTVTTCPNELTDSGLARAQGTFAKTTATSGDIIGNITKSFVSAGGNPTRTVTKICLQVSSSGDGDLFAVGLPTSAIVAANDTYNAKASLSIAA